MSHISSEVLQGRVGDPVRLRQILLNLLSNAIKFTAQGKVVLRVSVDPDTKAHLRFAISDTGIGIPPAKLTDIFSNFVQADSSTTRKFGGTGLGLAICKRLVEMMGGRIWAESRLGHGSTFYFTTELPAATGLKRHRISALAQLKGARVLLVDGNAASRLILRKILDAGGALVTEAPHGAGGLKKLKCAQKASAPYRLLLLDSLLPDMNGLQLTEKIRNDPAIAKTTIIMLSTETRNNHVRRARELGIAAYLVKPVKQSDLLQAIAATRDQTRAHPQPNPTVDLTTCVPDDRPLRILLAEDCEDNQLLIECYLRKTPYQLVLVDNGVDAIETFRTSQVDLILIDVQMPVMDGYTATRIIRHWEDEQDLQPTPIIALTAHALREDEQKSLDAGCTAHISKPIKKAELLEAIKAHTGGLNS